MGMAPARGIEPTKVAVVATSSLNGTSPHAGHADAICEAY